MTEAVKIWILLEVCLLPSTYGAVMAPPWANSDLNPCAKEPQGWQLLYWPMDGQCYKIFQLGRPCPDGMELTPATSKTGKELYAECKCPPKHALSTKEAKCYQLFTRGPCNEGLYFGPDMIFKNNVTTSNQQIGTCKQVPRCPSSNSIFWIKDQKCYQKLTRGPCSKGQLLTVDSDRIPVCTCKKQNELRAYRALDGRCYQHFTKGPCKENGHLFLPDQTCGCEKFFPHYHTRTKNCYELGTIGPCSKGEMFTILPKTSRGGCICRQGNIRYQNSSICYRPFTRGPCNEGEILINSTSCIPQPCNRGELYFSLNKRCFKIGSKGPCNDGQFVTFDFETRPSVDGISYNGVCVCEKKDCETNNLYSCDRSKGLIRYDDKCYKLYSQGPCSKGAWLAPLREGRDLLSDEHPKTAICECIPGNIRKTRLIGGSTFTECLPQALLLAEFLNANFTRAQLIK